MGVDKTGDDEAAAYLLNRRVRTYPLGGASRVADVHDAPVPDGERLGEPLGGCGIDPRVGDYKISHIGCGERGRRSEQEREPRETGDDRGNS